MQNYLHYIVSLIIHISQFLILCMPLLEKMLQVLQVWAISTSKNTKLQGLRTLPWFSVLRCHAYRMTLCLRRSFIKNKEDQWVKFAHFDPCRLINSKINRLHKSTYEEPFFYSLFGVNWNHIYNLSSSFNKFRYWNISESTEVI